MRALQAVLIFNIVLFTTSVQASSIVINPSDDATAYLSQNPCQGCSSVVVDHTGGVIVYNFSQRGGTDAQGVIKFSTLQISGSVSQALLTLSAGALPTGIPRIDVYGFTSNAGSISSSDANAGTFIGSWNLAGIGFNQDVFFDVTGFVSSAQSPYVGFSLRDSSGSLGVDTFHSIEYNLGHPSQLIVSTTPVPVPAAAWFLSSGLLGLLGLARKVKRHN